MEREIHYIESTKTPLGKELFDKIRVAAYCRVSSQNDEQYGSLETQVTYYTNLINKNPYWVNEGIYSETGSGKSLQHRKEFKKLLAKCRKKKVDMIITKSISRFSRNTVDALEVFLELRLLGIEVVFEKENLRLSNPKTMLHLEIACAFAQEEIYSHSQNIRWGIQYGFQTGTSGYASVICYGYVKGKNGLEIDSKQAKIVQMIFKMRVQGKSLNDISKGLQKKKIPSPTGKPTWSRETLNKLLKNEKYVGSVILQKTYVENYLTGVQIKNKGQLSKVLIKNHHQPIVSAEIFNLVNRLSN